MLEPVLNESFLSDAFAGREGQTPPFIGRAHTAPALAKNTLFIRMKLSDILDEVIKEYKLKEKATPDGSVYNRAKRGMYELPQSGLLANKLLEKQLNKHGYRQNKLVPGLWKHNTQLIQ